MSTVFVIPFRVSPAEKSIMPLDANGAFVSCYAKAKDFEVAAKLCVETLTNDGLRIEDILEPVHALDQSHWMQHISEQWPEHASDLPDQQEFDKKMNAGVVIYGPFGAF